MWMGFFFLPPRFEFQNLIKSHSLCYWLDFRIIERFHKKVMTLENVAGEEDLGFLAFRYYQNKDNGIHMVTSNLYITNRWGFSTLSIQKRLIQPGWREGGEGLSQKVKIHFGPDVSIRLTIDANAAEVRGRRGLPMVQVVFKLSCLNKQDPS